MTTRGKCRVIFLVLFLSGLGFAVSGAVEAQNPAQSVERHSVYVISKSEINTLLPVKRKAFGELSILPSSRTYGAD